MTAVYAGFGGLTNGALLDAAEAAGFDVLVTGDRAMPSQQNISKRSLAIVALRAQAWEIVRRHTEEIEAAIDAATPGTITRVDIGTSAEKPNVSQPGLRRRAGGITETVTPSRQLQIALRFGF